MGTFYLSAWDSFGPWFHASRKRAEEERNWLGGAGRGWEGLEAEPSKGRCCATPGR